MRIAHMLASALLAAALGAPAQAIAQPIEDLPARKQFDFWIGEWDVVNTFWAADRGAATIPGARLRVYPILGGAALVEHYRGQGAAGQAILGFSVRAFDAEKGKWVILLNWPSSDAPFWTMEGGFDFNRGVFLRETTTPEGAARLSRYIFSDLIPGFYRWEASSSLDGGRSWTHPGFVMEGTRRGQEQAPIDDAWLHGEDIESRCPGRVRDALDFMEGEWTGRTRIRSDDGGWIAYDNSLRSQAILADCARMNLYEHRAAGEAAYEAFTVFAYDGGREAWVSYFLNATGTLNRHEGAWTDGELILTRALEDGVLERFRWRDVTDDAFAWEGAISTDGGATWTVQVESSFQRVE